MSEWVLSITISSKEMQSVDSYYALWREHGIEPTKHEIAWAFQDGIASQAVSLDFHFETQSDLIAAQIVM